MTAALLRAVGEASLSAAVMILAVLVLRLWFQDRTPRRAFCLLWDIVLVRLLLPFPLPSPVSVRRLLPEIGARSAETAVQVPPMVVGTVDGGLVFRGEWVPYMAEDTGALPVTQAAPSVDWGAVLAVLWLAVALLLAGGFLYSHLRSRRVYAASLPVRDDFITDWLDAHPLRRPVQARCSDRIAAPLTYGVLYPVILLPRGIGDREVLSCVLAHEHAHIRRFDALRKLFLAAALCLHWFNPLVWAMYVLSNRDIELACDETVLRGGADRERYALALLGMEERRGGWRPSGSHFSGHALEERIKAIMKRKHISITAIAAVLVVMCITTTVFASAAPEGGVRQGPQENPPEAGFVYDHLGIVEDDGTVIMSNGKTGEKEYSVDGGKTWMSEERYQAEYGGWGDDWQVEWWTYEDYKAWLEEEKKALQEVIGSQGWTPSTGWFTWDQEKVDETIAMYEDILEGIKNGALYSKTIIDKNGNTVEDVALGSDGPVTAFIETLTGDDILEGPNAGFDAAALLEELKAFGIAGDEEALYYNGQLIRRFVDGASVGDNGYSVQYVYTNDKGTVDVHTLRAVVHNPDGSYDVMGELIGVAAAGDRGFDPELIEAASFNHNGPQTATAGVVGKDVFQFQGDIQQSTAEGNAAGERGRTFEEIFAQYEEYGLFYQPYEGGMGALSYNGQPVSSFADQKPDGGVFSYQDPYAQEGLTVYTQYDRNGDLVGLTVEPAPLKDIRTEKQELGFDYAAPVQGRLSASFGQSGYNFHYGVDLAVERGADVTAFADGVVIETGFNAVLGNYVVLRHEGGYTTLYGHCGSVAVSMGGGVAMGEKIAEAGASGTATGPMLHFELRDGETYLDPAQYLD